MLLHLLSLWRRSPQSSPPVRFPVIHLPLLRQWYLRRRRTRCRTLPCLQPQRSPPASLRRRPRLNIRARILRLRRPPRCIQVRISAPCCPRRVQRQRTGFRTQVRPRQPLSFTAIHRSCRVTIPLRAAAPSLQPHRHHFPYLPHLKTMSQSPLPIPLYHKFPFQLFLVITLTVLQAGPLLLPTLPLLLDRPLLLPRRNLRAFTVIIPLLPLRLLHPQDKYLTRY